MCTKWPGLAEIYVVEVILFYGMTGFFFALHRGGRQYSAAGRRHSAGPARQLVQSEVRRPGETETAGPGRHAGPSPAAHPRSGAGRHHRSALAARRPAADRRHRRWSLRPSRHHRRLRRRHRQVRSSSSSSSNLTMAPLNWCSGAPHNTNYD